MAPSSELRCRLHILFLLNVKQITSNVLCHLLPFMSVNFPEILRKGNISTVHGPSQIMSILQTPSSLIDHNQQS